MVDQNAVRASGQTAGQEIAEVESKNFEKTGEISTHTERATRFRSTGFARMSSEWSPEDQMVMDRLQENVDKIIDNYFYDALVIMNNLYDVVREKETDASGKVRTDMFGWPIWQRSAAGGFVEDWDKLSVKERTKYLFQITTHLFEWEQKAADLWAEAMYSKGMWEDAFSEGYEELEGSRHTVDARTARGRLVSSEARYFAIFKSHVSRRADAIVRSLTLVSQRLKDTLPS